MAANTPWCPRCGDWRGYSASLCKGCYKIEEMLLQLPQVQLDPKTKLAMPTADASKESVAALRKARAEMTGQRFAFVSERRTEREAHTQALEQFVDDRVDMLKTLAYEWATLRKVADEVKFSHIYALEMMSSMELALTELGGVSLELSRYDKNTPAHEERMQRIMSWMEVLNKFRTPDAAVEKPAPEENDDESGDENDSEVGS